MAEMKSKLQDFYKRLDSRKSTYFLVYSVIFAILAIGVFSFYFFTGKTFIWEVDGWEQHYKSLIYYSQYLRDFFKNIFAVAKLRELILKKRYCIFSYRKS